MKVLQINSVCGIRSTGRICTGIADALERSGGTCKVAYGRESVPESYQKYAVPIGDDLGVKLHVLQTRVFDTHGFGSKSATKKFIKWAREYDPDIIHLHNIHGYYINIELLFDYLKEIDKPVVWTLHDCWAFTGHCAHFSSVGCDRWQSACTKCKYKRNYPTSIIADNCKSNFKRKKASFTGLSNMTVVTPSRWLADLAKKSFLAEYPVKVINNGIDMNVFKPTAGDFRTKYGIEDKKIVLGVASAWCESKGFYDLSIISKLLGDDYKVVMVGLTDKQMREIPAEVLGITRTDSQQQLAEIYSTADVFVNPTYADTYPTTNLESHACGTPVITYDTDGSVETVPPENIVKQNDISGLVDKIKEIVTADNPPMLDMQGRSAEDSYNKYIDLYKSVINK